jgi:hypothetical protein
MKDENRNPLLDPLLPPFLRGRIRIHQLVCLVKRSKVKIRWIRTRYTPIGTISAVGPFNAKSLMLRNKEDSMDKHVWRILPTTILGKWSIGLIIAMPLLFVLGTSFTNSLYASIAAGDTILADIAARPALALTMLAGMGSGILAFITGILAIIKQKERAVLVYISSIIGALFILFLAGEILFPH